MNQFARWVWPGVFTIGVLSFLAIWLSKGPIENDLAARTAHALQQSGAGWVSVDIDGRDVVLSGAAYNDALRSDADTAVRALYGVRVVDSRSELVALQTPYTFRGQLSGQGAQKTLRLQGFVPDEATRSRLVKQAAESVPGAEVVDNLTYARGASDGFADNATFALRQLSGFQEGEVSLTDADFAIRGRANTAASFEAALSSVTNERPSGLNLASQAISPPVATPYIWSVEKTDKGVVMTGNLPSATDIQQTRDAVAQRFRPLAVDDRVTVAAGAPEHLRSYQSYTLDLLGTLASGKATLKDNALDVQGLARDVAAYEAGRNLLSAGLPTGLTVDREAISAPVVSPYTWSLRRAGSVLTMSGYVSSEEERETLVAQVQQAFPSMKLDDQTRIAAGAPEENAAARAAAIAALERLSDGAVELSNGSVSIRGMARDSAAYAGVKPDLEADLPAGHTLYTAEIAPPQAGGRYMLRAQKTGSDVTLTGTVPDTASRDLLLGAAASAGGATVHDELQFAGGAPAQFGAAVQYAMNALSDLSSGSATITDQAITLEGRASTLDGYEALVEQFGAAAPDGYAASAETVRPPSISPYTWQAGLQGGKMVLSGFAPDKATRTKLAKAARSAAQGEVDDRLRIADGAPEAFAAATDAVLSVASALRGFEASLSGRDLTLRGEAESEAAKKRIEARLRADIPSESVDLRSFITFPEPVVEREPATAPEPQAAPVGEAPSLENPVSDSPTPPRPLEEEDSQPTAPSVEKAAPQKPQQAQGQLAGAAETAPYSASPQSAAPDTPQMKAATEDEAPEQAETALPSCPTDFSKLLENKRIQFATARATIKEDSFALLDRIAQHLSKCEGKRIEIGGHTDSRGKKAYNRTLSKARAEAVKAYLEKKGIGKNQLVAKGYGESRPRVPNNSSEDLAKNRRIEFKLLP